MRARTHRHTHAHAHARTNTHAHTHAHTHTETQTHKNTNTCTQTGNTALHNAANADATEIARKLMSRGVNPQLMNRVSRPRRRCAANMQCVYGQAGRTPVGEAQARRHSNVLSVFGVELQPVEELDQQRFRPVDVVRYLLEHVTRCGR